MNNITEQHCKIHIKKDKPLLIKNTKKKDFIQMVKSA
jgi:hypothetical protein